MASDYKIFWTEEAIENLEEILEYLKNRWTQKEIDNFKNKLTKQIGAFTKPYHCQVTHISAQTI